MATDDDHLISLLADARRNIARILTRLTDDQWQTASLCTDWAAWLETEPPSEEPT